MSLNVFSSAGSLLGSKTMDAGKWNFIMFTSLGEKQNGNYLFGG